MRPASGDQVERQPTTAADSLEKRLPSEGRAVGNAIVSLGGQSAYSAIKQQASADRSSFEGLAFLGGGNEMLSRLSIGTSESLEVANFLDKLTAAQMPSNSDLIQKLQAGANRALMAAAHRAADGLAMQEVGKTANIGAARPEESVKQVPFGSTPPGGVEALRSPRKTKATFSNVEP